MDDISEILTEHKEENMTYHAGMSIIARKDAHKASLSRGSRAEGDHVVDFQKMEVIPKVLTSDQEQGPRTRT